MGLAREKPLILVLALFFISYSLFYSAMVCVLGLLGDQMSGLFRGIIIVSAAGISALFFTNQTHRLPTSSEKIYLIIISLFGAIAIDLIAGRIFKIKTPPLIIWVFDALILWAAFGPMLKKKATTNDDSRKHTH